MTPSIEPGSPSWSAQFRCPTHDAGWAFPSRCFQCGCLMNSQQWLTRLEEAEAHRERLAHT